SGEPDGYGLGCDWSRGHADARDEPVEILGVLRYPLPPPKLRKIFKRLGLGLDLEFRQRRKISRISYLQKRVAAKSWKQRSYPVQGTHFFYWWGGQSSPAMRGTAGGSGVGGAFAAEDEEAAGGESSGEEYEGDGLGCGAGR